MSEEKKPHHTHVIDPGGALLRLKPIDAIWYESQPRFLRKPTFKVVLRYLDREEWSWPCATEDEAAKFRDELIELLAEKEDAA